MEVENDRIIQERNQFMEMYHLKVDECKRLMKELSKVTNIDYKMLE